MSGIVGRFVSVELKRAGKTAMEACEVMACQTGGEYGYWRLLVATRDGQLVSIDVSSTLTSTLRLIPLDESGGPYR